jgi:hypothetical protein
MANPVVLSAATDLLFRTMEKRVRRALRFLRTT